MKTRERWIDELRGFALVLVIAGHVIGGVSPDISGGVENDIRRFIYLFHMPLLFIVSGMVRNDKDNLTVRSFFPSLLKNVISLYVPYLLFGYLFWAVKFFIYAGNEPVTVTDALRIPYDYHAWVPGWYLLALLGIKVVSLLFDTFFFVINTDEMTSKRVRLLFWLVTWIVFQFIDIDILSLVFNYGIYYELGTYIKVRVSKKDDSKPLLFILLPFSILLFANTKFVRQLSGMVVAIALAMIVTNVCYRAIGRMRIIEDIGRKSMIPYVLHAYFTIPVRIILNILGCSSFSIYVLYEIVVCVLLSWIAVKIVDKVKALNSLFYPGNMLKK